jgi:hypothetical protein
MKTNGAERARPGLALVAAGAALVLVTSGCGGGGDRLPSATRTGATLPVPSGTASRPDASRSPSIEATQEPTPTAEEPTPTAEEPTPTAGGPTRTLRPTSPTPEQSTATVTATPTPAPTETVTESASPAPTETVTETPTPTPTPTPSPSPSATSTDLADAPATTADTAVAPWVWWLLLGSLLAAGLAVVLVPRARRRREWAAGLAADEAEATWVADELLPRLQAAVGPDALAGGWQVGVARVSALEDRLTGLEATAHDDTGRARAQTLRDAVRATREGVDELVDARLPGPRTGELGLIARQLRDVVTPPAPPGPPASAPA